MQRGIWRSRPEIGDRISNWRSNLDREFLVYTLQKHVRRLRSKSVQRAGFAGGVEADNTIDAPKFEIESTDYDECLACQ